MAQADPELRDRQPWKAAYERDYSWLSKVLAEHYAGNDTNVRTLLGGVLAAYDGISVEDFESKSDAFLHTAQHPTLNRGYLHWPVSLANRIRAPNCWFSAAFRRVRAENPCLFCQRCRSPLISLLPTNQQPLRPPQDRACTFPRTRPKQSFILSHRFGSSVAGLPAVRVGLPPDHS